MTGLLILAGGKAERLKDKMFLKIYDGENEQKEMIKFVYDSFRNFEFEERCIAIKKQHFERMEKIFSQEIKSKNLKLLIDEQDDFAPIYGILNMEKMKANEIFLTAGDSLFAHKIYKKINEEKNKINNYDAIVPLHKFIEPLNALYKKDKILNSIKISIKNKEFSIKNALSMLNVYYIRFNENEFVNINTLEDLERFKIQAKFFQ